MFLHRSGNMTLPRLRMLASTERDAKDFKWHQGQSYVWGVSIMDLHERKTTQLTGYLWPRCDGCDGRSGSGSLAKLGRYPSSLRPHLFGYSRLPGDGDIHPQHRGGREKRRRFQQVLQSTCSALPRGFWRETTPDTLVPPVARLT